MAAEHEEPEVIDELRVRERVSVVVRGLYER
jgi:hypothetical protein